MATRPDGSFYDARKRPQALTDAQRQARYRQARLAAGQPEIRGLYAHPSLHAQIRAFARSLETARSAPAQADTRQHTLDI
jgi:hypothetical protein